MDNLKIVNDQYGHIAGDELIRQVAGFLQQTCRVEDIIARIGGDEFAILLPNTSEQAVQALVNRLRANLQNQPDPRIRVSIGCATGADKSSLTEVMRLADDRMYQEKMVHKNQTSIPPKEQPQ